MIWITTITISIINDIYLYTTIPNKRYTYGTNFYYLHTHSRKIYTVVTRGEKVLSVGFGKIIQWD